MPQRPFSLRRRNARCLLQQAQASPDAFAEFYDAYARRVLIFFTRRISDADAAFDLTSETFAKALEHRAQFRGRTPEEEQGWLFAIARGELSHYWRRGTVERKALQRLGIEVPELTSSEIEQIERLAGIASLEPLLHSGLDALPEDQRRAVQLRVVDELGYPEIAERLAVTEDVVRARVSRGLRALRAGLPDTPDLALERSG